MAVVAPITPVEVVASVERHERREISEEGSCRADELNDSSKSTVALIRLIMVKIKR